MRFSLLRSYISKPYTVLPVSSLMDHLHLPSIQMDAKDVPVEEETSALSLV